MVEPDCTVELNGDSVLNGAYTTPSHELMRLQEPPAATIKRLRPKYTIKDNTLNGQTSAALAQVFYNRQRTSRFIVIENGIIEAWRNESMVQNLRSMAVFARGEGRTPILTGLSRFALHVDPDPGYNMTQTMIDQRDAFDAQIKAMAAQEGIAFAEFGAAPFSGASDLLDTVHPTKAYSDRLVARLVLTLDALAPECK
uniref:SGNH hydrolase-type esterase domain-containing protein n=1 Tax=Variovorax sp. HH01 TaxID=1084736 RepID=I3PCM9_9BURK|nr:hypothetical protein var059 [Variovorax sp. HH01]